MTKPPASPDPFGALAPTYDRMGFLTLTAQHLARAAALQPGMRVLDVATGTGTVALAAAQTVGTGGTVVGLDLSAAMVEKARARTGAGAVSFQTGDAMHLPFEDASFDAVLCASALFFMPDLAAALREWGRVLKPGGRVGFTAFAPGLMAPLPAMWAARLKTVDLVPPGPPVGRLPSPEKARELLEEAGYTGIRADTEPVSYLLEHAEHRWDDIEAGLEGLQLRELSPEVQADLRAAHLAELASLFASGPLTVSLPLIVAFGTR